MRWYDFPLPGFWEANAALYLCAAVLFVGWAFN